MSRLRRQQGSLSHAPSSCPDLVEAFGALRAELVVSWEAEQGALRTAWKGNESSMQTHSVITRL